MQIWIYFHMQVANDEVDIYDDNQKLFLVHMDVWYTYASGSLHTTQSQLEALMTTKIFCKMLSTYNLQDLNAFKDIFTYTKIKFSSFFILITKLFTYHHRSSSYISSDTLSQTKMICRSFLILFT